MNTYDVRPYPNLPGKFQIFNSANEGDYSFQSTAFESEAHAVGYRDYYVAYWAFCEWAKTLPAALSRTEYEAACAESGFSPQDDGWCKSVAKDPPASDPKYHSLEQYPAVLELSKHAILAARRYAHIRANTVARPKIASTKVDMVMCDCGHEVPAGTRMIASLGTSCPSCYDRMSG